MNDNTYLCKLIIVFTLFVCALFLAIYFAGYLGEKYINREPFMVFENSYVEKVSDEIFYIHLYGKIYDCSDEHEEFFNAALEDIKKEYLITNIDRETYYSERGSYYLDPIIILVSKRPLS